MKRLFWIISVATIGFALIEAVSYVLLFSSFWEINPYGYLPR